MRRNKRNICVTFLVLYAMMRRNKGFKYLPGVLKTGLPEILSQVQHIAGNLSKLNSLKALILLV